MNLKIVIIMYIIISHTAYESKNRYYNAIVISHTAYESKNRYYNVYY